MFQGKEMTPVGSNVVPHKVCVLVLNHLFGLANVRFILWHKAGSRDFDRNSVSTEKFVSSARSSYTVITNGITQLSYLSRPYSR